MPLTILALCSGTAQASPMFETLGSPFGNSSFGARATGAGPASSYFNPALLTDAAAGVSFGFVMLREDMSIRPDRLPGDSQVSADLVGLSHADGSVIQISSFPSQWLADGCNPPECRPALPAIPRQSRGSSDLNRGYGLFGLVGSILDPRLALGMYAMVPIDQFMGAYSFYPDEREQFFSNSLHPELLGDRLTPPSFAFGAGFAATPSLSLGVSVTLVLINTASALTYVRGSDQAATLLLSNRLSVLATAAPHMGLRYRPFEGSTLTATVHSPQRFDIDTEFLNLLSNGNAQKVVRNATHAFMPWQFGLGLAQRIWQRGKDEHLSVSAQLKHTLWSTYVDRMRSQPAGDYAWQDLPSGSLGLHHETSTWSMHAEGLFEPSPVPEQRGRTSYVAGDRIGGALGGALRFRWLGANMELAARSQLQRLLPRRHRKLDPPRDTIDGLPPAAECANPATAQDNCHEAYNPPGLVLDELPDDAMDVQTGTPVQGAAGIQSNNPGYPGYSHEGWLMHASLALRIDF